MVMFAALRRHSPFRVRHHREALRMNDSDGASTFPQRGVRQWRLESLVERVGRNDPTLTRLTLDRPEHRYGWQSYFELLKALWDNDVIRQVSIGPRFFRPRESQALAMVVSQLVRLENLTALSVCSVATSTDDRRTEERAPGRFFHQISSRTLAALLQGGPENDTLENRKAPELVTLEIRDCNVVFADDAEVLSLSHEFENHPTMEKLVLSRLYPAFPGCNLDPLVEAMARIPHLKSVELGMARVPTTSRGSTTAMSPYAIASLAIHPQLRKLVLLPSLNLSEHEIVALFQRMIMLHVEENSRAPPDRGLQHLQIGGNLAVGGATDACWRALLRLLQQGSAPCLWKVDMPPPTSMDEEEENRILQEVDDYLFLHRPSSQRVLHASDSEFPKRLASFVAKDDSQNMEDSYRLMREGSNRLEALAPQAATE